MLDARIVYGGAGGLSASAQQLVSPPPGSHLPPPPLPQKPSHRVLARCALLAKCRRPWRLASHSSVSFAGTSRPVRCAIALSDERFPRRSGQQGKAQPVKLPEIGQQGIVVLEVLAKPEPRIEHDAFPFNACLESYLHAIGEIVLDLGDNVDGLLAGFATRWDGRECAS